MSFLAPGPAATTVTAPTEVEPDDHERFSHIVLEGYGQSDDEFVKLGPSVMEGIVYGTPVTALCGKVWVPNRDPNRYPLCPTCKEVVDRNGWPLPNT